MMKNLWKIVLIGVLTIVYRIIAQCIIPASDTMGLEPSLFVKNGTLPIAFTIYGILVYTLIAAMFLLVKNNLSGHKLVQGLQYGLAYCVIWVVYLFEPLPHVIHSAHSIMTVLAYPLADGIGLLILGLLVGALLGKTRPYRAKKKTKRGISVVILTICFVLGRLFQYYILNVYSSIHSHFLLTMVWTILAGLISAWVIVYFNQLIVQKRRLVRALLLGSLMFGLNLMLFNLFVPLIAQSNIIDVFIRTIAEIGAVFIGCLLAFGNEEGAENE